MRFADVRWVVANGASRRANANLPDDDRQIADVLFISPRTASFHVANLLAKLDVDSRTAAAAYAVRLGLA